MTALRVLLVAILLAAGLVAPQAPAAAADLPYLTGRTVDNAEILAPTTRERISAASREHERNTTNQVVVLTVPSLGGESIEDYATRVFEAWKLGRKDRDNGVLLLVAPKERRMRIEVGYGLEGVLPDAIAARIIRDVITPRFKAGDYDNGVADGVEAIIAQLEGRSVTTAAPPATGAGFTGNASEGATVSSSLGSAFADFDQQLPEWPMRILMGAFIFGIIGLFTVIGVVTPGTGWFLYVFLIPFWAMFPIVVVGVKGALILLGIYIVGFPIAKLILRTRPWYGKAADELKRTGQTSLGGIVVSSGGSSWSSSSSGSSSSGSSSSSGGFSGGGGSSGGGGASGSW